MFNQWEKMKSTTPHPVWFNFPSLDYLVLWRHCNVVSISKPYSSTFLWKNLDCKYVRYERYWQIKDQIAKILIIQKIPRSHTICQSLQVKHFNFQYTVCMYKYNRLLVDRQNMLQWRHNNRAPPSEGK